MSPKKIALYIFVATSILISGCRTNSTLQGNNRDLLKHSLPDNFLNEEQYFIAYSEVEAVNVFLALRRAESDLVDILADRINGVIGKFLDSDQRLPGEPRRLPYFSLNESSSHFLKNIERELHISMNSDSTYKAYMYGRFPKNEVPDLIIPEHFDGDELKEEFLETGGIEWLREIARESYEY